MIIVFEKDTDITRQLKWLFRNIKGIKFVSNTKLFFERAQDPETHTIIIGSIEKDLIPFLKSLKNKRKIKIFLLSEHLERKTSDFAFSSLFDGIFYKEEDLRKLISIIKET